MVRIYKYDETGKDFLCVVAVFLWLILIPSSYYFWPNPHKPKEKRSGVECNCDACIYKEEVLKRKDPRKRLKRYAIRIALILAGWILFAFVAYKITQTAMVFGISLPSWIVDKEDSVCVVGLYALVFMVALPTTVGIWWYRRIQYSRDKVLPETTKLYCYYFHKTPQMQLKRALMVLAASSEFEKRHNLQVQERVSDRVEVPQLIKQLPNLNEKNKERPLCFHYSIKARALLHAHLSRMLLPANTLELDRQLVVRKSPFLIQEMVTCVSELIMLAHAGKIGRLPTLDTIENVMKMSPMIVQALWESKSPMMQLPHITDHMQKYFMSEKRQISTVQQFCQMKEEDRRNLLKALSADQYADVIRVCALMPLIDFKVTCEVLDDKESAVVKAGSIVTVTVLLTRNSMGSLLKGESAAIKAQEAAPLAQEYPDEHAEDGAHIEGKSKISHPVHCPYYPEIKQEYWWIYVSDRENEQLVTAPYLVTNLVRVEEHQLQFTAPRKPGHCKYTVCLRSDSFIGIDQTKEIKLDVQEAKHIDEHPQRDIIDEEEEEFEYPTDDDSETEEEEDEDED